MLKSHVKFHSNNGKRLVLIADDELINRELLRAVLEADYELLFATDGAQALELIRAHRNTLSLVLLDLMMPNMDGMELLREKRADAEIQKIPVIVLTSDQNSEVECLRLGAIDFIPKPYPQPGVIQARVLRTIELSEDRDIIQYTERDSLTGLYNREYFYRYAEQFDQHHVDLDMDAIVLDVYHFHMINERYGKTYADDVLRRIGEKLRDMVFESGGIVCRRQADTFMVYCPHREDYQNLLESASIGLSGEDLPSNRVRLRMGVYSNVDKSIDIELRFDRAKLAADTVRSSFVKNIAIYDNELHEKEMYAEQLIEDFHIAIQEEQFTVFYQPKFDVRPEIPVLASAEALVRWKHPKLGMISPGVFIPLFEDNGLIQELDLYVWEHAAAQIEDWKARFGYTIPVSVNVSRIDMYDPNLIATLQNILQKHGLQPTEFLLEITESAYTQDSEQIIETVHSLRKLGFQIEMDDFGTGYSSLNMISTLPIDALKLDMQFIRNAFNQRRDTRMLEVIIDIADYLSVPTIAEGVETEEQLNALKAMGCDIVQGYYFSRPVPPEEYERFMVERMVWDQTHKGGVANAVHAKKDKAQQDVTFGRIAHALSSGFESIYYVDTANDHYVEFSSEGRYEDLQIARSGANFFLETQQNIPRVVYSDDQTRVALSMQKEALLSQLVGTQPFSMTYRLVIDGAPMFYNLKAMRASTHDNHHIVIGISNVDEQFRQANPQEEENNPLNFNSLAQALSSDMESIYYVDVETGSYMEFVTEGSYGALKLEISGSDFFADCKKNVPTVVYADDQSRVNDCMDKEYLLSKLRARQTFSMDYRLVIQGHPLYYRLKAMFADGQGGRHIIIGVSNIDSQISDEQKLEAERQRVAAYSRIAQALAQDYFSIYYVDTQTDHFIEYSAHEEYDELNVEKSGDDFFSLSRKNILRVIYPEDQNKLLTAFTKEAILKELGENRTFTLTYRLMFDGVPTYVNMKASRMEDINDPHIVIGVSSIDAQMKREEEYKRELDRARQIANRDALTGVKSKRAFVLAEEDWNDRIRTGAASPFAVVVCDVNGLKAVNDTLGHKAGDKFIQGACAIICNIFKHSPVYRIGGDEFVALLSGQDFESRAELIDQLCKCNQEHIQTGEVVIACGMSEWKKGEDLRIENVFDRADALMYETKKALKAVR
ncbi:MAG: EAL domain-containing protein [Clostridia bacterium]|nr:EAL domain-containing protein [Clostridia bacterium]